MDGVLADKIAQGLRIRPATLDFARRVFPRMIVRLREGLLQVDTENSIDARPMVTITGPDPQDKLFLLRSDFDICRQIAENLPLRVFPSDTLQTAEQKALAQVLVLFRGR